MTILKRVHKMTPAQLVEMAAVLGITHDGVGAPKKIAVLQNKIQRVVAARGVEDHTKVIADHPVEQEKPPKYLYEIKESSCFGRMFDTNSAYCTGKCGFAEECVNTLERLALQVQQGQQVLTQIKKGRSVMALKKNKVEEAPKKKKSAPEAEAPAKKKVKAAPAEEAPAKKKKSAPAPAEEAPKKGKKGKGGTDGAVKVKVIEPFGEGRFLKVIAEKNPLQPKDTAFDLAATLVEMGNGAKGRRLTQAQFFNAINQHFVIPEDAAKAEKQIKEVAEELKQKSVAKIVLLKAE